MKAREYNIRDILGVTTGVFLGGDFLEARFLVEDVGRAELCRQMPWLEEISFPREEMQDKSREEKSAFIKNWLEVVANQYGENHMVYPPGQAPAQPTPPKQDVVNPQKALRSFIRRRKNSP